MSKQSISNRWWRLAACAGIAAVVTSCSQNKSEADKSTNLTQQTATPSVLPAPNEVWMTEFQQINGTPYLYAPIYVADEEQRNILKEIKREITSASSYNDAGDRKYNADIRNYMFVHRDDLSASKLFSGNSARLLSMEQIGETVPPDKSATEPNRSNSWIKKVQALWFVKVSADTNGDKLLNAKDRQQIAISDPSGANYTEVIKDIDKILLVYPKGLDRRLVIYKSGTKRFVADVDIPKRQATVKELPAVN